MKRILKFKGVDSWSRPVYEVDDGTLFVDVDPVTKDTPINLHTKNGNHFDGEPDMPIRYTKFRDDEITVDRRITWH